MNDLKYAARMLVRTPLLTAIAVLSLALGIGANTAIYSLFEQLVRAPLPVPQPEQLLNLSSPGPKSGHVSCGNAGDCDEVFSYPMFRDLEREQKSLTGLAAHSEFGANVAMNGQTRSGSGLVVSGSYFPVLGLKPALGRLLGPADDRAPGASPVAVLSHGFWRTALGADPGVLNRAIVVNGQPFTIVGVAPRGFRGTTLGTEPDIFLPLTMYAQVQPGFRGFDSRSNYWIYLFGRLKPGVMLEQAAAGLNAVYHPIVQDVEAPLLKGMSDETRARFEAKQITVQPGGGGQSSMRADAKTPIVLLLAITAVVLLIACANIANLLLARGTTRGMELAVRLSMGASRARVVRQLLTESVLLGLLGGAASLLVASWTLSGIASLLPAETTSALHLSLRPGAMAFAGLLALATGLLFGLFPALYSARPDLIRTLRASTGQVGAARSAARFRTALVTAQIGLSMALLISAGLFIRSLINVSRVDLGVRIDDVVTFGLSPEQNGYTAARSAALFDELQRELGAVPGLRAVTASTVPILADNDVGHNVSVQGFESGPDVDANANENDVGAGYFRALGVPLIAGREFSRSRRRRLGAGRHRQRGVREEVRPR